MRGHEHYSPAVQAAVRAAAAGGRKQKWIAGRYGMSQSTVSRIIRRVAGKAGS